LLFFANRNRIYKFDSIGSLVPGFETDGVIVDPRPALNNSQYAHDIAIGPDGQLYLMGNSGGGMIWLMKRDPLTGNNDLTFGNDGLVVNDNPEGCAPTGLSFYNNFMYVGHHTVSGYWSASRFSLSGEMAVKFDTTPPCFCRIQPIFPDNPDVSLRMKRSM
jgi:hypothetical protein